MKDPFTYPKLRWPIDIRVEKIQQQEVLLITCPLGIAPAPLGLVPAVGPIISCFEGQLSVDEICNRFAQYGVKQKLINELVALLDKHLFLDSPSFGSAEKLARNDFAQQPTRPAALAGLGYAGQGLDLEHEIKSYLAMSSALVVPANSKKLVALVAPHIDYNRGKQAYAATYSQLSDTDSRLYILIGTSHQYSPHIFHLTEKSFESPLGPLRNNASFTQLIAKKYGIERSFADEFLHKREHSLELQVPFLRYLNKNAEIAPILVGSFHHMLSSGRYPEQFEAYDAFVSALLDAINEAQKLGLSPCFIAGVDMAHVGRAFGDKEPLSPDFMGRIAERDKLYLRAIESHDKHALFDHIAEDQDQRRICGFPTMYTVLDAFDRLGLKYSSQLFDYRQAVDYDRQCAVTFAGMGFYPSTIQLT